MEASGNPPPLEPPLFSFFHKVSASSLEAAVPKLSIGSLGFGGRFGRLPGLWSDSPSQQHSRRCGRDGMDGHSITRTAAACIFHLLPGCANILSVRYGLPRLS